MRARRLVLGEERLAEELQRADYLVVFGAGGAWLSPMPAGLGLPLVKHIAEAHGGRVTVESEQDKGSTFTIYLPIGGPAGDTQ